jgi:hypothetical protein
LTELHNCESSLAFGSCKHVTQFSKIMQLTAESMLHIRE